MVSSRNISGGTMLNRPVSSSTQEYGTIKADWPLTEPITKLEALTQTSGIIQSENILLDIKNGTTTYFSI